jgi:hypothetical protein
MRVKPNRSLWWLSVLGAAVVTAVPAQADSGSDPKEPGSISGAIEDFGQSLCPALVKPGSSLATTVSEMQGNTGLTPTLTGMVTGLAIQMECPAFMKQVASGDLSALKLPGAAPDTSGPLKLPGLLGGAAGQSGSVAPKP